MAQTGTCESSQWAELSADRARHIVNTCIVSSEKEMTSLSEHSYAGLSAFHGLSISLHCVCWEDPFHREHMDQGTCSFRILI